MLQITHPQAKPITDPDRCTGRQYVFQTCMQCLCEHVEGWGKREHELLVNHTSVWCNIMTCICVYMGDKVEEVMRRTTMADPLEQNLIRMWNQLVTERRLMLRSRLDEYVALTSGVLRYGSLLSGTLIEGIALRVIFADGAEENGRASGAEIGIRM